MSIQVGFALPPIEPRFEPLAKVQLFRCLHSNQGHHREQIVNPETDCRFHVENRLALDPPIAFRQNYKEEKNWKLAPKECPCLSLLRQIQQTNQGFDQICLCYLRSAFIS